MKLTTKREELVAKLSIVSRAVSTRAATQALSGVLITAAGDRVRPWARGYTAAAVLLFIPTSVFEFEILLEDASNVCNVAQFL